MFRIVEKPVRVLRTGFPGMPYVPYDSLKRAFSCIGKARLGMRREQGCCVICCKLFIVNDLPKTVFLRFFRHKRIMIVPGRVFARFSRYQFNIPDFVLLSFHLYTPPCRKPFWAVVRTAHSFRAILPLMFSKPTYPHALLSMECARLSPITK